MATDAPKPKLQDFAAELASKGLAVNNRYVVLIPDLEGEGRFMSMFCSSVQLPGITVLTTPARHYGEITEMPYEISYAPITMEYYVDPDYEVKKFFDKWAFTIFDPKTRTQGYYEDYKKDIDIFVYNKAEDFAYKVTLYEAYVKDISPITKSYADNQFARLTVTLQFKYWRGEDSFYGSPQGGSTGINYASPGGINGSGFDISNIFQDYFSSADPFGAISSAFAGGGVDSVLNSFGGFQDTFNAFRGDPIGTAISKIGPLSNIQSQITGISGQVGALKSSFGNISQAGNTLKSSLGSLFG